MLPTRKIKLYKSTQLWKTCVSSWRFNGDNILINSNGKISIIDFAESVQAPKVYEDALIAIELFNFDKSLLVGYFGGCNSDTIAQTCFDGLLIHDFGGDIIKHH